MPGGGGGDGPHVGGQAGGPLGVGAVEVLAADHRGPQRPVPRGCCRFPDIGITIIVPMLRLCRAPGRAGGGVLAGWGGGLAA